jgi:3-deoxy-manno-octulosonate cytidylyltransferase (CMP-KDO synthetase)
MSIAIILPARLASMRLPNKLLLDRSGKTVLEHTIERAREAVALSKGLLSSIIVATDHDSLLQIARKAGVTAVLTDPNHASGTDRVAEAAAQLKDEIIVNLQADEPEIDPQYVVTAAKLLAEDKTAAMSTLAVPIFDVEKFRRPNVVKVVIDCHGKALLFSRAPIPHVRDENDAAAAKVWTLNEKRVYGLHHLGLYAYRRDFLLGYKSLPPSRLEQLEKLEQLRALEAGHTIKVGVVKEGPPGIDTPEEYEAFLKRQTVKPGTRN